MACSALVSTGQPYFLKLQYSVERMVHMALRSALLKVKSLHFNLFRLRDKVVTTMTETAKRYVITNPAFDFGLLPTDQVSFGSDFV